MKVKEIKKMITAIVDDGSGIIYNDEGNGCGGSGFADPDTLVEMLMAGDFDDARQVPYDEDLLRSSCRGVSIDVGGTDWTQIEFNFSADGDYNQIAWIWEL